VDASGTGRPPVEPSPFATELDDVSLSDMREAGPVRYLIVSGRRDDGLWGPIGALWLSEGAERGGFLVHPWGTHLGSEMVRGYRSALRRGFTADMIYGFWRSEVWIGSNLHVDEERVACSLALLNDLLGAL
jgi:hypothetical protein